MHVTEYSAYPACAVAQAAHHYQRNDESVVAADRKIPLIPQMMAGSTFLGDVY